MTQKEFIEVAIGGGNHIMVSISSIAFVQPANNGGARINMKETNQPNGGAFFIDTITSYHTIKFEIENYLKS